MSTDDASMAGNHGQPHHRAAPTIELAATEVRAETASKSGFWRLLGAAVGGGAVALGGFWAVNTALRPDTRLAQVEQQMRALGERPAAQSDTVSALDARIAKMESAIAALEQRPSVDPSLANRIARVESETKSSGEIVTILNRRTDETATLAREARQRADVNAAAIAELGQKVTRLSIDPVGRSDVEGLSKRLAALESSEKTMSAELAKRPTLGAKDPAARFVVASTALREAVDRGAPFVPQLAMTRPFVKDSKQLAPLEVFATTGVPSAASLSRQLSELAPALYQAAGAPPRDNGLLERLTANAEKLVRLRPVQDVAGTDPSAIVMRIEVRAARSDIAGALAELAKLPADARAPAEDWIKRAEARTAALKAANQIAADAMTALEK